MLGSVSAVCRDSQFYTVLRKFWQYSSTFIQFAVLFQVKKMCPTQTSKTLITLINVNVPCVVADLLDKEYRPLPRDGVGAMHGLQFITVQTGEWHTVHKPFSREKGQQTKKRWTSTADAHNAIPPPEEDEKTT